jgi:endonuclease/exonuclease/phosphatase (EEP) superfamily protein YafD
VYIPPERSSYYDEEIFDDLENDIVYFSKKGNVMLLGDFNARTSKLEDFVSNRRRKYLHK